MRLAAALAAALLLGWPAWAQEAPQRAPFITTPAEVVARMLAMARTGPGDFIIDLGFRRRAHRCTADERCR